MLTQSQWNWIDKQSSALYNELELEIIKEIAERIASVGYANTVVLNNIRIAQEMGILYQDIIRLVAKYNDASVSQVKKIFETAGAKTIEYDDNIYMANNLNPVPVNQSIGMLQLIEATARRTNFDLSNLMLTTANESQTEFYNVLNKIYLEVSTGVKSYSQSLTDSIKELSLKGSSVLYPSGRKMSIESAVRMNLVTSINQMCGKLQETRAEEMNCDLMELTAHKGARPSHAEWQGKIVSRSGKKGYLSLDDIGYGKVDGFKGINCRHDWRPFFEGSPRTYTDEELEEMKNATVQYNGKDIPLYEATQIQRRMERTIRNDKKQLAGLQGILTSDTADNKLIEETRTEFAKRSLIYKTHQNELNNFISQTELKKDNTRLLSSSNYNRYAGNQVANVTKIANKYNNSDIIGMTVNNTKITSIGEHIISRTYARSFKFEDIENVLKTSQNFGKIKIDDKGRKSFCVFGKDIAVVINPDAGNAVTVRKMNKSERNKYESKK